MDAHPKLRLRQCGVHSVLRLFVPSGVFLNFLLAELPGFVSAWMPVYFQAQLDDPRTFGLLAQFQFLDIILQIVEGGVGASLFSTIGRHYETDRGQAMRLLALALGVVVGVGAGLAGMLLALTPAYIRLTSTPPALATLTTSVLRTRAWTLPLTLSTRILTTYMYISTSPWLVVFRSLQLFLSLALNFLAFGPWRGWVGWMGTRWTIADLGLFIVLEDSINALLTTLIFCVIEWAWLREAWLGGAAFAGWARLWANLAEICSVSFGALAEQTLSHVVYFCVLLRFVNQLGEGLVGGFHLLTLLLWSLYLIPLITLANYAKVCVGASSSSEKESKEAQRVVVGRLVWRELLPCTVAWLALLAPVAWLTHGPLIAYLTRSASSDVRSSALALFRDYAWAYLIFGATMMLDAVLIGDGQTLWLLGRCVASVVLVDLVPWVLNTAGWLESSYWLVIGMAVAGIAVEFVVTLAISLHVWRTEGGRRRLNDEDVAEVKGAVAQEPGSGQGSKQV